MQTSLIIIGFMAIFGTMANPAPMAMGVEVVEEGGRTIVREVVSFIDLG